MLRQILARSLSPLPPESYKRYVESVLRYLDDGHGVDAAILEALNGDPGQVRGQWILMQVDWRDVEEVEWQAQELASTWKIAEPYSWNSKECTDKNVEDAIRLFGAWLEPKGFSYLSWDQGDEQHYGFVIPHSDLHETLELAQSTSLQLVAI